MSSREGSRGPLELRPVTIETGVAPHAEGSCLYTQGLTRVLVTASVEDRVPPFLREKGEGWITAEYGMLPRATHDRQPREAARGRPSGRTLEIQRLVGRALRGAVDRTTMPDKTITLDCDVLVADAGTRCASITGGYVALVLALAGLYRDRQIRPNPLREAVAAISVGIDDAGSVLLDLDYREDSSAGVDLNVVGTSGGRFVEIQGTAEREPFDDTQLLAMLDAARKGLSGLFEAQRSALRGQVPDDWLERDGARALA